MFEKQPARTIIDMPLSQQNTLSSPSPPLGAGIKFVTGNNNKFLEVAEIAPGLEMLDIDLPEIQSLDPKEVLRHKLVEGAKCHSGKILLEDTSLAFAGRNGFPGPLVKWVLKSMSLAELSTFAMPDQDNRAHATVTIGYSDGNEKYLFDSHSVEGTIVPPRNGQHGFGWDDIFVPIGSDKTFSQMTPEEKRKYSMRPIAVEKIFGQISQLESRQNPTNAESFLNRRTLLCGAFFTASAAILRYLHSSKSPSPEKLAAAKDAYARDLDQLTALGIFTTEEAMQYPSDEMIAALGRAKYHLKQVFVQTHSLLEESDISDHEHSRIFDASIRWSEVERRMDADVYVYPEIAQDRLSKVLKYPGNGALVEEMIGHMNKMIEARKTLLEIEVQANRVKHLD